jgi:hypothetical protein
VSRIIRMTPYVQTQRKKKNVIIKKRRKYREELKIGWRQAQKRYSVIKVKMEVRIK